MEDKNKEKRSKIKIRKRTENTEKDMEDKIMKTGRKD